MILTKTVLLILLSALEVTGDFPLRFKAQNAIDTGVRDLSPFVGSWFLAVSREPTLNQRPSSHKGIFVSMKPIQAPNYTQVPNVILDNLFLFTHTEFKVAMFICRKTFGFHKNGHLMSLSYFENGTGLNRETICNAIQTLAQKGMLLRVKNGDSFSYGLNLDGVESLVGETDQSEIPTSRRNRPLLVGNSDHLLVGETDPIKETINKETIKERRVFKKPTQEEMNLHAAKIGLPEHEAVKCFNYYESNGWKVGKNPMKSWQAAMINWRGNWQERNPKRAERPKEVIRSGEEEF